jgi:hypothetical protein
VNGTVIIVRIRNAVIFKTKRIVQEQIANGNLVIVKIVLIVGGILNKTVEGGLIVSGMEVVGIMIKETFVKGISVKKYFVFSYTFVSLTTRIQLVELDNVQNI